MKLRESADKFLTPLEHVDFIVGWIVKAMLALGGGASITWLVSRVVELSDGSKSALLLVSSAIVLWVIWRIVKFFGTRRRWLELMVVYLPILIGLAFCGWAYYIATTVNRVNVDSRRLKIEMMRYVLPRHLTQRQIDSIGNYLSHQEKQQVVFNVINRDEEASSFRADLQQALAKGGWAVSDIKYSDDVQEGLGLSIQGPLPRAQQNPFDVLHPKPTPVQVLADALKQADVQVQSMGSGGGINIAATTITISVGRRRRDRYAVTPQNFGQRPAPNMDITDDDFN